MSSSNSIVQLTATQHFPIKLTPSNFPTWRKQILSTLIGLDLDKHITGSTNQPSKFIAGDVPKPNPEYNIWFRQDQIIISALLGSLSETIQPIVSSAETARQAWDNLNASYASTSRSRIIFLKSKLAKNPKGTRTITEFLHDMKNVADALALAQSPVKEEDLIVHILNQLGDEYSNMVAAIKARDNSISYPELFDKLVDFEQSIKESEPTPVMATVNYTHRTNRPSQRNQHDNRSGRSMQTGSLKPNRPAWPAPNQFNNNRSLRQSLYCQYCSIPGHNTKECRKLARFLRENNMPLATPPSTPPIVNTTSTQTNPSPSQWMMFDTGASNHVTPNQESLHTLSEYGGPDEIVLGDGSSQGGASHARNEPQ
ncbi:putative RNA-directed DNA polymerase [Helianthus annuus]|nr:putative RNA-directed DNA polymerase [Helianthus annuus]